MRTIVVVSLLVATCAVAVLTQDPADAQHLGDKFLLAISQINTKIHTIHHDYELNKVHKDKDKAKELLDRIKAEKTALTDVKMDVNAVLSSLVSYNVLDKVYLEFARIMADSYSGELDQIAFEILGEQAGISEFRVSFVSDGINVASALLKGKFDVIVNELADVDHRMNTIMTHKDTTADLFNELRILNELTKAVEDALSLKIKLYQVYTEENEKAMLEGKQLNILQKNDVDLHILMIDWLIQFVRTYQELIRKLVGTYNL